LISLCKTLIPTNSITGSIYKLISGVIIIFFLIAPVTNFHIGNIDTAYDNICKDANQLSSEGSEFVMESISKGIEWRLTSYILDKATEMDLNLDIQIQLCNEGIPQPETIKITGTASPYTKKKLVSIISTDLGITEENIVW
jgi:hypothetical protein